MLNPSSRVDSNFKIYYIFNTLFIQSIKLRTPPDLERLKFL